MARAQRSQLLLEALAAAAEHKRYFFFSGLGFLSKLGRAERVSAQTASNSLFPKQELQVQPDPIQQDITRDVQVLLLEAEGRKGRAEEYLGSQDPYRAH